MRDAISSRCMSFSAEQFKKEVPRVREGRNSRSELSTLKSRRREDVVEGDAGGIGEEVAVESRAIGEERFA